MSIKDREARNKYIREWKYKNRRKIGLRPRVYPIKSQEEIKLAEERKKEYKRRYDKGKYQALPVALRMIYNARRRAKAYGVEFSLVIEDIVVPTHCPILGIELIHSSRRGTNRDQVASLDRKNPTGGYTKDNIEVISSVANTMKSNATPEILVKFSKEMLRRYENTGL